MKNENENCNISLYMCIIRYEYSHFIISFDNFYNSVFVVFKYLNRKYKRKVVENERKKRK